MGYVRRQILQGVLAVLATLAVVALSGCFPDYSCTEVGCSGNLRCNTQTGNCEELVRSCVQSGCPQGKVCEPSTGLCRSEGARCVDDSCPSQQVCNAQTGYCEARTTCEIDPCTSPGEQCDRATGQCVPLPCVTDEQCPVSFYCATSDQCRPGCRIGNEQACPAGQFCRGNVDQSIGQCRDECHRDEECPLGQQCEETREGSSCEVEPPCDADADCRAEGVCYEHRCQAPPCTSDQDCGADEICELATGVCLGGSCQEDVRAPNQTRDDAVGLRPGRYTELTLCPGKSDWFSLHLRSSDALSLRLEHAAGADLDIFVYAEDARLLAANQQKGPVTTVEFISERDQDVYVQIRGTGQQSESYDLNVERNPDQTFCRDDASEENDGPAEAVVLPTDTSAPIELSQELCGFDEDWFVLPALPAHKGLALTRLDAAPDVAMQLLTPDDEFFDLPTATTSDPDELRVDRLGAAGDYFVRVHSWYGRSSGYRLRTQVLPPLDCPQAGAHNTAQTAVDIPVNAVQRLAFCPIDQAWEVDWLALQAAPTAGTLTAQVVAAGDLPALDVILFDASGGTPQRVRRAAAIDDYYQLRVPVSPGQQYLMRISAAGAPGRIVNGVDYQAFYRFESSD